MAGSSSVKRQPWPGSLSTRIRPPCSLRIFWLTGRPRPVPRLFFDGDERAEEVLHLIGGNARAVVVDGDPHQPFARRSTRVATSTRPRRLALADGVDGVGHHVQHRAVDALGIEDQRRASARRAASRSSTCTSSARTLHQLDHVGDHLR